MGYPVPSDLSEFMIDNDYAASAPDDDDLQSFIDEAIVWWETKTSWFPFLATGTKEARSFELPDGASRNGILVDMLGGGIWDKGVGLTVAIGEDEPTIDGGGIVTVPPFDIALTIKNDFILSPDWAPGRRFPFDKIRLLQMPGSVRLFKARVWIVNDFGFTDTINSTVKKAILRRAAAFALADTKSGRSGQALKQKIGSVLIEYDANRNPVELLTDMASEAIEDFRRL